MTALTPSQQVLARRERIIDAIMHAREVQDFLWGNGKPYDDKTWLAILQKRMDRLTAWEPGPRFAMVEKRKRVLQLAAVAVKWLETLPEETDAKASIEHAHSHEKVVS